MTNKPTTPKRLWKYRKWNDHARAMVETGKVKFSTFSEINDPFEGRHLVNFPKDPDDRDKYVRDVLARHYPDDEPAERRPRYKGLLVDVTRIVQEAKGKPVAWEQNDDSRGMFSVAMHCNDILMWSHYADKHQGVCISILPDTFGKHLFYPMSYEQYVPIINAQDYLDPSFASFQKTALSKSEVWEYEQEWRTASKSGVQRFPECVERIVIGALADDATRKEVTEAVANAPQEIQIHEARLSNTRFAIIVDPSVPK